MILLYLITIIAFGVSAYMFYKVGWKAGVAALSAFGAAIWAAFVGLHTVLFPAPAATTTGGALSLAMASDDPIKPILTVICSIVLMYLFYRAVRKFLPGYGTLLTNGIALLAVFVDILAGLPWGSVLAPGQIGFVTMGLAVVNAMMRVTPTTTEPPMIPASTPASAARL